MDRKKKILFLTILVMAVGFATVSATLYINGSVSIGTNKEEFETGVIFTRAETDNGTASISDDGKTITYITGDLKKMNEKSKLDFTIKNKSKQYDADAKIDCYMVDEANKYNDYITVVPDNTEYYISSGASVDGYLMTTLVKNAIDSGEVSFKCEIVAEAVERTEPGIVFENDARDFKYMSNSELGCNDVQCALEKLNELVDGGE